MPRAIYFFPHNPYPTRSGAHKRCLEVLASLAACGYETTFASASLSSETIWRAESRDLLLRNGASAVNVYETTFSDRITARIARAYYRRKRNKAPISSILTTPPGMQRWFRRLCRDFKPQLILLSYPYWDRLLDSEVRRSARCAVDTIDLSTINFAMHNKLKGIFPKRRLSTADIPDTALTEDYFEDLSVPEVNAEYGIFDQYDIAICISPNEKDLVAANTRRPRTLCIPMSHDVVELANNYSGPALYTTGPSRLNTQGYFYFAKRVLPQLRREIPEFELNVTGSVCERLAPEAGVNLLGFVPDLRPIFENAKFLICPIVGKTGQQVKIVEAMAHGLPVVALTTSAVGSPIQHGVNGWIARDAAEFAGYCVQLWRDEGLCRRMGIAARDTIAAQFSRSKIQALFAQIG